MREFSDRELLLEEWFLVYEDDEGDDAATRESVARIRDKNRSEYLAMLEPVPISRCPFTSEILRFALDLGGLDGPFWDVRNPVRHPPPPTPRTFVGLSGAVQLTEDPADVPAFPFLAMPGPEVPYVLPAMLERDDVVAVVSTILVVPHAAFAVAYFARPGADPTRLPPMVEWGTTRAWARDDRGDWMIRPVEGIDESTFDYELAPWIEREQLRWIEPYDKSNELRSGLRGCPYVGQPGHREVTRIENLEVWWPSDRDR